MALATHSRLAGTPSLTTVPEEAARWMKYGMAGIW